MSPLPPSRADAIKGQKASRLSMKQWVKLKKQEVKALQAGQTMELAKAFLQSPVLSGVAAYLAVEAIQYALTAAQVASTKAPTDAFGKAAGVATKTGSDFLNKILGPIGPLVGAALGNQQSINLLGQADFVALKGVILIYIASGGNLAGLLGASSGIIGDVLKGAGLAGAVGA